MIDLILDVDSTIPNIALMKIATYLRINNKSFEFKRIGLPGYRSKNNGVYIESNKYDKVYVSTIFSNNKGKVVINGGADIVKGGSGESLDVCLPKEIEHLDLDYSLYPDNDYSYGFITRGCIRNCPFCIVPKKEGKIYLYQDWRRVVRHKKVMFLDNNFLAYKEHKKILSEMVNFNLKFQFNQGLDIRLVDEENADLLSRAKYLGEYLFAFDNIKIERLVDRGLTLLKKYIPKKWRTKFYVYCHPDMPIRDVIYRIEWLRSHYSLPYLMRDTKCWDSENRNFYIDLAAYCNQPSIFKTHTPEEYIRKRQSRNQNRINLFMELYKQ